LCEYDKTVGCGQGEREARYRGRAPIIAWNGYKVGGRKGRGRRKGGAIQGGGCTALQTRRADRGRGRRDIRGEGAY